MGSNSKEFEAFQNYLTTLIESTPKRRPLVNSEVKNISLAGDEQPCVNTKEKIEGLFNSSTFEGLEDFFDKVNHSITNLGEPTEETDLNVSHVLNLLFETKTPAAIPNENVIPSEASVSWADDSILKLGIDASFNTMIKENLKDGVSKCVQASLREAKKEPATQHVFQEMGPFYGLPLKVEELIKTYKGIEELYDWQAECLNLPAIKAHQNLIYALPTSGGKTLVAEILMLREIICYKRNVLFILPYVAIVQEKVWALSPFAVALDFLIEEYAASKGSYPPKKRRRKHSIYIATIEKALGLLNSLIENDRIDELGLIVVDELHLIGEPSRGATLEGLLTKMMCLKSNTQILGMSATIGNIEDICRFLNADMYTGNFRPVELTEFVKCGNEIATINWGNKKEELFTLHRKTDFGYNEALTSVDPDQLGGLIMEVVPKGSCLIFCPSKRNCENVVYLLCRVANKNLLKYKKAEKDQIKASLKEENGTLCSILQVSIDFGIAYHHSGLTGEERKIIEEGFRSSVISVICCTSTLAAGVNLPATRVILRHPYIGAEFLSLARYKQMVGRAGRAGLGEKGDSILICNNQDLPKVREMFLAPMNKALSNLHEADGKGLRHFLLSCINLGIASNRVELQEIAKNTMLAIQSDALNVNVKKLTDKVISDLFKLRALEEADLTKLENNAPGDISVRLDTSTTQNLSLEENQSQPAKRRFVVRNYTKLSITKLGRAAIRGNFELSVAHMLNDDLHQAQRSLVLLNVLHLLYLVTPYEMAEQIKPNKTDYYNIYNELSPSELQTARTIGLDEGTAVKFLTNHRIKSVPERILNRFYLALMLYELWNERPVFEVSGKFQVNRGLVQNLMTSAATFASNVVYFCECLEEFWTFAHLLKGISQRLMHCCVRELLPLMELPSVKQNRAKQLYKAGYTTLQSIAKAGVDALVDNIEFLPRRMAQQLVANAKMLLLEKVENLREEAEDVLDGIDISK